MDKYKKEDSWPFEDGTDRLSRTSVRNDHYSLRNNPEQRSSHWKICRLLDVRLYVCL
jgi:hypothetical protein